ncbi:DUF3267 domain-containing protein [Halosimplex pelagicum]|uniref:DUF3267 domain-containing protein n=1 Tax=Halosimplex pelagicum TaxID=869886 RepID=A0A7D5TAY1_9EURY|nr:DUF3267 domain-containing protein [Halosimplex pelagicum]QLH80815.1 DUF3267 domain-containing protein [Halosimplex pelagicum]
MSDGAAVSDAETVPESDYDPGDALVPETPAGYDPPTDFRYSMVVLTLAALVVTPVAMAAFGAVLWRFQGPTVYEALATVTETESGVTFTFDAGLILGSFLLAVVVTVVVNEAIHGLVFRYYGYDVSYGAAPHMGAFYATPFHQFVCREHAPPVALAPLVVISLVGLPLIALAPPLVAFFVFQAVVFNAIGAVGDLYATIHALRLPPGSLYYDSDIRHSYVFRPSESDG